MMPNDSKQILERLTRFMQLHRGYGILVNDLAKYAGCCRENVYRWIRGETKPRQAKIELIRKWLALKSAEKAR